MKLPTAPKAPLLDINQFTFLLYGPPKIGKTTTFSTWPDILFLSTEPGTKGLSIYEVQTNNWAKLREAVTALESTPDQFSAVCIDTVDRAYDYCLDYVCKQRGIEYPGEDAGGKNDFGKSWKAVRAEFLEIINRIINTGRGLCLTSHASEMNFRAKSGITWDKVVPSMSKQARVIVEALVDIYFYMDYVTDANGITQRVIFCQGDETLWAGHRATAGRFPDFLISPDPDIKGGQTAYEVIEAAFLGNSAGANPQTLRPAKETAGAARRLLQGKAAAAPPAKTATTNPVKRLQPLKPAPKKRS